MQQSHFQWIKIDQVNVSPDFKFFLHYPEGVLADFISLIWASEGKPPFLKERIVPDGANVLLFNFGNPVVVENNVCFTKTLFAGVGVKHNTLNYESSDAVHQQTGVVFKPGGAYPFIQQPIIDFKNTIVEASILSGGYYDTIYEQIGEINNSKERIARLTQILTGRLKQNFEDNLSLQLINLIRRHPEKRIEDISRKTGYSQQHLNRMLGKFAGANVKAFQKIFRFNQAIQAIRNMNADENLTDIAYEWGYFDQAHFIHDFKEMTGLTPKAYSRINLPEPNRIIYLR